MIRLQNTLLVNTPGASVGLERRALVVRSDSARTRVPLESLDGVVMVGGVNITSDAIAACARSGIRVAALTRAGRTRFTVSPEGSGNVLLRVAQVRVADDVAASLELSRLTVAAKLRSSERLVSRWMWDAPAPRRDQLSRCVDQLHSRWGRAADASSADELRGIEGDSARTYFKAMRIHLDGIDLAKLTQRRTRRPPGDPLNAALSFGYALLTTELIGAAESVGLDPQIGFFHGVKPGRPALALDVLEEMRSPIVDRFVASAVARRQLRLEHFRQTPGGAWYLNDDGRSDFFALFEEFRNGEVPHELLQREVPRWALAVTQMTVLARRLRGDLPTYVPWTGQ